MRRVEYEKTKCIKTPERFHRSINGNSRGFVCNACGAEILGDCSTWPSATVALGAWDKADICERCVAPWLALIAKLKIAPESRGLDVTDYAVPSPDRPPPYCVGCADDAERAEREKGKEPQKDRGWLARFLGKVGVK